MAIFALLEAAATVPGAEGVGEAGVLDEETASLVAGDVEEHDVLAHVGIGETFGHRFLSAGGAADFLVLIPHALRVELTLGFVVPAVLAVSLASRVGTVVVANFRITPDTNVANGVSTTVDVEVDHHGVLDVDENVLRVAAAASVSNCAGSDVDPN